MFFALRVASVGSIEFGDDEALHRRGRDPLHRRPREHAVGDVGVHLGGALADQELARLHEGPGGVDDVVDDDADPVPDLADHRHRRHLARARPPLVDDGEVGVDPLGELARPRHPADVGRDDGDVGGVAELVLDVEGEDRRGIEVVDRDVEEALDLRRVQVEGQHPLDPGDREQVRHQLGADRGARLRAAILPGIAEIGHHRGDPVGRRPAERIAHDEQLHQVVVRRVRGRLDDEHVLAADVLEHLDEDFRVVEPLDPGLDQLDRLAAVHRDPPGDRLGQRPVRVARDQLRLEQGVRQGTALSRFKVTGVRLPPPPTLAKPRDAAMPGSGRRREPWPTSTTTSSRSRSSPTSPASGSRRSPPGRARRSPTSRCSSCG